MITCRFILKSGATIDHVVTETIARRIHEIVREKKEHFLTLRTSQGDPTHTIEVHDISAYIQL